MPLGITRGAPGSRVPCAYPLALPVRPSLLLTVTLDQRLLSDGAPITGNLWQRSPMLLALPPRPWSR